ncbi:MAG: pyridoxal-phosphate dependent enzyme [Candidatus Diapherotrites archaeon]
MRHKSIAKGKPVVKLNSTREKLFKKIISEPGNTPLIELNGVAPNGNRIFVKLEYDNPTGSHYARVYPLLLSALEKTGISPSSHVLVETSSGNATVAFAHYAKILGYKTIAFMPRELSRRRLAATRKEGAIVVLSRKGSLPFVAGARDRLVEALLENKMAREKNPGVKKFFSPNHSQVIETLAAIKPLAKEVRDELKAKKVKLDYFLPVAGNGTIAYGVGRPIKKYFPKAKIIAVEPFERPVLYPLVFPGKYEKKFGERPGLKDFKGKEFFMPGSGAIGIDFPHLHSAAKITSDIFLVRKKEWKSAQKKLAKLGFNVGQTSAASFSAAMRLAKKVKKKNLLIIFYDKSDRY